jgi:hypothetical protein
VIAGQKHQLLRLAGSTLSPLHEGFPITRIEMYGTMHVLGKAAGHGERAAHRRRACDGHRHRSFSTPSCVHSAGQLVQRSQQRTLGALGVWVAANATEVRSPPFDEGADRLAGLSRAAMGDHSGRLAV